MKNKIITILFFSLGISFGWSQAELWPKKNANWHYFKYSLGIETYLNYSIDRDTIIQGKNCQIYTKFEKHIDYTNNYEYEKNEHIGKIISLEDSVLYHYNISSYQFDTIIDFKANMGDSWRGFLTSSCPNNQQDSIFEITVTNKSIENINGIDLNTFELTYSSPHTPQPFVFTFYQLFGTLNGGELNEFDNCDFIEAVGTTTNCFIYNKNTSDAFVYHRNASIAEKGCDYIPHLDLTEQETFGISIVNPIKNRKIEIVNPNNINISNIQIYNNLGQVLPLNFLNVSKSIYGYIETDVKSGIYFCKISLESGKTSTQKIIVE